MKKFVFFALCFSLHNVFCLDDKKVEESHVVPAVKNDTCLHAGYVSMSLFHEMYCIFCARGIGGDDFFDSFNELDPPTPENGNKDFRTRYTEWANEQGKRIPNNMDNL
ncbi:MAG: hypothetical protein LBB21_05280 [Holosporaceae bacterium]|nr:hypothetical protein [Holosporaceae bacterium]